MAADSGGLECATSFATSECGEDLAEAVSTAADALSDINMKRCLFCANYMATSGQSAASKEHILPVSLTGNSWLVTHWVCRRCNNTLGTDVDSVADRPPLVHLRHEAGIAVSAKVAAEDVDERTGQTLRGNLNFSTCEFESNPKVVLVPPDGTLIVANGDEEACKIAKSEAEKCRRQGRQIQGVVFFKRNGQKSFGSQVTKEIVEALKRLGSKAAVEFVASIASPDVALQPALDPLRKCALQGETLPGASVGYTVSGRCVWLPRTRGTIWLDKAPPSPEEEALLNEGQPIAGAGSSPRPVHCLLAANDADRFRFELILFSLIRIEIGLPRISPLIWDKTASYDVSARRGTELLA